MGELGAFNADKVAAAKAKALRCFLYGVCFCFKFRWIRAFVCVYAFVCLWIVGVRLITFRLLVTLNSSRFMYFFVLNKKVAIL